MWGFRGSSLKGMCTDLSPSSKSGTLPLCCQNCLNRSHSFLERYGKRMSAVDSVSLIWPVKTSYTKAVLSCSNRIGTNAHSFKFEFLYLVSMVSMDKIKIRLTT